MAISYRLTTPRLGSASVSNLVKSAATLQGELNTFNDTQAKIDYENSSKSTTDVSSYLNYLSSRVSVLRSSGKITDATKALTMQQDMVSATHSHISAEIQRENIQILAGNATKTDKLNLVGNEYKTALNIGDNALAQSLESQSYTLSQEIQYEAQQASASAKALSEAKAGGEQNVVQQLDAGQKALEADIKATGMTSFNALANKWVEAKKATLGALGVKLTDQPNYFDVISGITAAKYNAHMLAYQAELPANPQTAQNYFNQAQALAYSKVSTIAGDMTPQELFTASVSPKEFAYDQTTGTLKRTQATGYQYLNYNGQNYVAPTYSGNVKQNVYLTPTQTALMSKLGLSFSMNTSGADKGTAGNGVQVQASTDTPNWLKQILGTSGVTNVFSVNGNLQFEGDSSTGLGKSFYTVGIDSKGLAGLFENTPDSKVIAMGGDYGFNANAVQNLLSNAASKVISIQQQAQAAQLKLQSEAIKIPSINFTTPTTPNLTVNTPQSVFRSVTPQTANPQATAPSTALQNPAQGKAIQNQNVNLQGSSSNLNTSGSGGIRL